MTIEDHIREMAIAAHEEDVARAQLETAEKRSEQAQLRAARAREDFRQWTQAWVRTNVQELADGAHRLPQVPGELPTRPSAESMGGLQGAQRDADANR